MADDVKFEDTLEARMQSLEARTRRLEDLEEIRDLRSRYVQLWDAGYEGAREDGDALAELFVADCVWDGGPSGGRWEGRDGIRAHFASVMSEHRFGADGEPNAQPGVAVHYGTNPTIEVDGDSATGSWSGLIAASFARHGLALWIALQYDDEYVRTPEGWRFRSVRATTKFATPFDGPGWVRARVPSTPPSSRWGAAEAP